jgi:hypothetical protein
MLRLTTIALAASAMIAAAPVSATTRIERVI